MPKFEVIRPWNGVTAGQVITLDEVHPSIAAHVRPVSRAAAAAAGGADQVLAAARGEADSIVAGAKELAGEIVAQARTEAAGIIEEAKAQAVQLLANVAPPGGQLTPATTGDANERRDLIKARLKELKIEFDGRKGEEDLAALLPEGELATLFPAA